MQKEFRIDHPNYVIKNTEGHAIALICDNVVCCVTTTVDGEDYNHHIYGKETLTISDEIDFGILTDYEMSCDCLINDYVYMTDHPDEIDKAYEKIPGWYNEEIRKMRKLLDVKESTFQEYLKHNNLPEIFSLEAARHYVEEIERLNNL